MKVRNFWKALTVATVCAMATVMLPDTNAAAAEKAASEAPWPEAYFEIFRLAPGKHEEFVRLIALSDQVSAAAGLPPTQLFFHQEGADWDVLVFKPASPTKLTARQEAAMAAKQRELNVPSGPAYFVYIRSLIASHTDTKAYGPISAEQWLKRLASLRTKSSTNTE